MPSSAALQKYKNVPHWLLTLLMLLAVAAWSIWNGVTDYRNVLEQQYRLLEVRAQQREARISGALRSVNLMLGSIVRELPAPSTMPSAANNQALSAQLRQLPELRNLLVTDAAGRVTASSNERLVGFNAAGREYFSFHRDQPASDAPHVSLPFKIESGLMLTTLSRVVRDAHGRFAGVVVATLDGGFFDEALKLLGDEPGTQYLLINLHGDILNLVPHSDAIGKNLQGGIAFTEHLAAGQETTRHLNKVKLGQVVKMSVFQNLPGLPLAVIVSRDYDSVMADWRQSIFSHIARFILLAVTTIALLGLAMRRQASLLQAQQALAEREIKLRTIIDTEPECVLLMARDCTVQQINRAGLQMVDADDAGQLADSRFLDIVAPDWQAAFIALTERVFDGESGNLEFEINGRRGSRRWLDMHAVPLRDTAGQVSALLGVARDVTAFKQNQDALILAKQAAEQASEAKSRFLATMSHEIRTPMNGILGMAQLLLMSGLSDAERLEFAQTIIHSGQNLMTLLNDILDLSKVEAGKLELASSEFDPEQLVAETLAWFAEPIQGKGLNLEVKWHGLAGKRYRGDPARLRQMLANLLSNAIKFTAQGAVQVDVAEVEVRGKQALLEFAVTDSGIGIAADKLGQLFEPFSQLDSSTTREFGGTGLGLSIVRNLARLMGGDVGVASEEGRGARFWFRILVDRVETEGKSHGVGSDTENLANRPDTSLSGRILVVEDNATNRKFIEAVLGKMGLEVVSVLNGEAAVATIQQGETPDLVLMDLQMPVMDGYEATKKIRQWESQTGRPRLPIIALTADAFEEDRLHCLEVGMDDFLTKPLNIHALTQLLGKWLPQRTVNPALADGAD